MSPPAISSRGGEDDAGREDAWYTLVHVVVLLNFGGGGGEPEDTSGGIYLSQDGWYELRRDKRYGKTTVPDVYHNTPSPAHGHSVSNAESGWGPDGSGVVGRLRVRAGPRRHGGRRRKNDGMGRGAMETPARRSGRMKRALGGRCRVGDPGAPRVGWRMPSSISSGREKRRIFRDTCDGQKEGRNKILNE
ncbi:hypothetical protein DFH08DRAFT_811243 [Mycena albidolilacea]|uniref:Uncharacterized protein n=1 Tax=Mycena albidolilacea TaxID=1033008 RepID=A0AAD6ZWE6_9AGAR|nr:hypothetical protein DFH08DRAFT_811243 [Mycena albidolilacea]